MSTVISYDDYEFYLEREGVDVKGGYYQIVRGKTNENISSDNRLHLLSTPEFPWFDPEYCHCKNKDGQLLEEPTPETSCN